MGYGEKEYLVHHAGNADFGTDFFTIAKMKCTLLARNKRILSTGYNDAPAGLEHCDMVGCAREGVESGTRHELCRAVHAEQNAIIQAALHGIGIERATLYCTHQPCILCAKMMINARISRVVYVESYPDSTALQFLKQAGIEVARMSPSLG